MAKMVRGWFSKPGKGFPQVHLKDFAGNLLFEDDEKTKPLIGNEQYEADQIESLESKDLESLAIELQELCSNDFEFMLEVVQTGWNRVSRLKSGGLDDYQKAAKKILALGLPNYKGKTLDEVAELLRKQEA